MATEKLEFSYKFDVLNPLALVWWRQSSIFINSEQLRILLIRMDFRDHAVVENLSANAGDTGIVGSILGLETSPGGWNGNSHQYSFLENPMDREAWQTTVHGVTMSQTRLSAGEICIAQILNFYIGAGIVGIQDVYFDPLLLFKCSDGQFLLFSTLFPSSYRMFGEDNCSKNHFLNRNLKMFQIFYIC